MVQTPDSTDSSSDTSSSLDDDCKGKKKKKTNRSTKKSSKKNRKGKKRYNESPDSGSDTEMDLEGAQKINKHHKKLSFQMGDTTFTGTDPIAVNEFLQKFKLACDQNGFSEGTVMWLFQFYLKVQAYYLLQGMLRGNTLAMDEDGTEMLESCPEVVISFWKHMPPMRLSKRLSRKSSLTIKGLAIRSQVRNYLVRNYLATNRKVVYNGLARYSQGLGDTLLLGKRPAVPPTLKDKPKRSVLEIEDTTTSEGSSHLEVPTGIAIHWVGTQGRFSNPSSVPTPYTGTDQYHRGNTKLGLHPSRTGGKHRAVGVMAEPNLQSEGQYIPRTLKVEENTSQPVPVCHMKYNNYKVRASMCFSDRLAVPVTCMLDTGARPNVLNSRVIPKAVLRNLSRPPENNPLVDVKERPLNLRGMLTPLVQLGHLKVRLQFFVVDRLPTDCLLGTTFIDRHVKAILPGSHTVALRHGGRISILGNTETKRGWFVKPKKRISTETVSNKVCITKQVVIPPMHQILVPVSFATPGLVILQNHPRLAH
ncbi:unnamed protein product [Agarophyton chilense]